MLSKDVVREMVRSRNLTTRGASAKFGRSTGYVSKMLSTGHSPNSDILAEFADILDYDLLLRDRTNGTEIIIDPPQGD